MADRIKRGMVLATMLLWSAGAGAQAQAQAQDINIGSWAVEGRPAPILGLEKLEKRDYWIERLKTERDVAVEQRDFWAARAGRCPFVVDGDSHSASVLAFMISQDADPKTEYGLVKSDNPDISVCLINIAGECTLGYDGKTHALIATRSMVVKVQGKP